MKLFKTLLVCFAVFGCTAAYAVTEREMEQARTTAAKVYLRWSNNMSGYLDNMNPTTMADLEAGLRDEERKNLEAFKSAGVPSNYSSWDKEELVKYWTVTFFDNAKGLQSKGASQGARGTIKKVLNKMDVSAPNTPEAQTPAAPGTADPNAPSSALTTDNGDGYSEGIQQTQDVMANNPDEEGATDESAMTPAPSQEKKSGSGNWIYILILIVLIIAVILLVVYASRTMKGGGSRGSRGSRNSTPKARRPEFNDFEPRKEHKEARPKPRTIDVDKMAAEKQQAAAAAANAEAENARMREKYSENLAEKQEEIRSLSRKVADLQSENVELSEKLAVARKENETLKTQLENLKAEAAENAAIVAAGKTAAQEAAPARQPEHGHHADRHHEAHAVPSAHPAPAAKSEIKEIYLGRVNANGMFVRADRAYSPGNSVYKLITTDGFSGTYRVVDNRTLEMLALEHPEEYLGGGCVAKDIADTIGRTSIITESAGTAIFEGGAWRVIRKARIRYD